MIIENKNEKIFTGWNNYSLCINNKFLRWRGNEVSYARNAKINMDWTMKWMAVVFVEIGIKYKPKNEEIIPAGF